MKNNKRSKYWAILLYDESDNISFNDKIDYIKEHYTYCYIKHDKDDSKIHYHIVLKFPNYVWLSSLIEQLDIPPNYFQAINSLDNMLVYLIHYNSLNKFQYSIDEVNGSYELIKKLKSRITTGNLTDDDKMLLLLDFIENSDTIILLSQFFRYACSIGLASFVRTGCSIYISLIQEHNYNVSNSKNK